MKERGILFSAPMVRAILDGSKTQTRRLAKGFQEYEKGVPHPDKNRVPRHAAPYFDNYRNSKKTDSNPRGESEFWCWWDEHDRQGNGWLKCPYGKVGDRLWVREEHYLYGKWTPNGFTDNGRQKWRFRAEKERGSMFPDCLPAYTCKGKHEHGWFKRNSLFMPRWASRITLEIVSIRVERLQDISEEDAIAEGCPGESGEDGRFYSYPHSRPSHWYTDLWESINGKGAWAANPWVWVVEFRRVP